MGPKTHDQGLYEEISRLSEELYPEAVRIRRHLHKNPELSFFEHETTRFIIDYLKQLGVAVEQPMETGCLGIIEGDVESDRVIALRADIDALPIQEEGEHKQEFLSRKPGIAHCCGHDLHTANLLSVAAILHRLKNRLAGKVVLVFQAGEEKLPGGGRLLCESGALQQHGVQGIYGLHTYPFIEPGNVLFREGALMARPDEFQITVYGQGGHAAAPHQTVDPVVLASQIVSSLQTVVSRTVNPTDPAVLTVGKIEGGSAHNIIPSEVTMLGTVRTFDADTAHLVASRIEEIVSGITRSAGGDYAYQFDEGYPAVINAESTTRELQRLGESLLGGDALKQMDRPIMAGEDFAFYQQHFPGTFFFLGSGSRESGAIYSWHHPCYNVDESSLKTGMRLMSIIGLKARL